MKLYDYWRSTTSFRVRAALNLKRIPYDIVPIDLGAGDQSTPEYLAINPSAAVPTLLLDEGIALSQSMAILDYVDAIYPDPQLIPADPLLRARVLSVAHSVALDIHPMNNLRVMKVLETDFGATCAQRAAWMVHWMTKGFLYVETQLNDRTPFAFGETPNIADLCIVAQTYNAERWGVPMHDFPKVARVARKALAVREINKAHPANQPNAKEYT